MFTAETNSPPLILRRRGIWQGMVGPSAKFRCSNTSKKRSKQKVEELKPIGTNQTHMYEYIKSAPTEHIRTYILNRHQQLVDATALLKATIDGGGSTACAA